MIAQPVLGGLTIIVVIAAYAIVLGAILIIQGVAQKISGNSSPATFA